MKKSILQSQVSWVHVIAVIYTCYVRQNRFVIHLNASYSKYAFKRITLSFVYFWQVILFWAVMLHTNKSNIENISQTLSKSMQQHFCKNSWDANSLIFKTLSYSIGASSRSISRKLQEIRTNKEEQNYKSEVVL